MKIKVYLATDSKILQYITLHNDEGKVIKTGYKSGDEARNFNLDQNLEVNEISFDPIKGDTTAVNVFNTLTKTDYIDTIISGSLPRRLRGNDFLCLSKCSEEENSYVLSLMNQTLAKITYQADRYYFTSVAAALNQRGWAKYSAPSLDLLFNDMVKVITEALQ